MCIRDRCGRVDHRQLVAVLLDAHRVARSDRDDGKHRSVRFPAFGAAAGMVVGDASRDPHAHRAVAAVAYERAAGEMLIAALPEHEFTLPGQLVADAAVARVDHEMLPEPKLTVELELLLLVDG